MMRSSVAEQPSHKRSAPGSSPGASTVVMTLCGNLTAQFTTESVRHIKQTPPRLGGDDYVRQRCLDFLLPLQNPVLLDAGANIGQYSLLTVHHPGLTVIAFEPYNVALRYLQQNIELNGVTDRIQIHPVALSNQAGHSSFLVPLTDRQGEIGNIGWSRMCVPGQIPSWGGTYTELTVPTQTLDSFDIARIDVMKIDVEGGEDKFIGGGLDTITRCRPIIIMEAGRDSHALRMLLAHGYELIEVFCAEYFLRPKPGAMAELG